MSKELNEAINLFQEYKLDEAQELLESIIKSKPDELEALIYLGKIHSRTQNYGVAMNYFNSVLEIQPNNSAAKTGLTLIKNILQLTNNFYFENSYTDDDLYDFD